MSTYNIPDAGKPSIEDLARVNAEKRAPKFREFNAVKDAAAGLERSKFYTPGSLANDAASAARMARGNSIGPQSNPRNLKGGRTRKQKRSHKRSHKRKTHRRRR